jgi:hypothetical protein
MSTTLRCPPQTHRLRLHRYGRCLRQQNKNLGIGRTRLYAPTTLRHSLHSESTALTSSNLPPTQLRVYAVASISKTFTVVYVACMTQRLQRQKKIVQCVRSAAHKCGLEHIFSKQGGTKHGACIVVIDVCIRIHPYLLTRTCMIIHRGQG